MAEIIGMGVLSAVILGLTAVTECLPSCGIFGEATESEKKNSDSEDDNKQYIKIKLEPVIVMRFNNTRTTDDTKSNSSAMDNTIVASEIQQVPDVILQSTRSPIKSACTLRQRNVKKKPEETNDLSQNSKKEPLKYISTDKPHYDTSNDRRRLIDASITHSNKSQNVSMQAFFPQIDIDSSKSISNAVSQRLLIPTLTGTDAQCINCRSSNQVVNCTYDETQDTQYFSINHPCYQSNMKNYRCYPSTSSKLSSKCTIKNAFNKLFKRIDSLAVRIHEFWSHSKDLKQHQL